MCAPESNAGARVALGGVRLRARRRARSPPAGLAHTLLGIETHRDLFRLPKLEASWEGVLIGQIRAVAARELLTAIDGP
jgi:hypothetical protein